LYLIAYGLFRFAHEFVRAEPRIMGPLSGYQFAALAVLGLGVWGFVSRQNRLKLLPET
jgi:phosphatidylglycerol:prolipoprotein diacylglycerol transferase